MAIYVLTFGYKLISEDHTNFISQHISNFAITGLIVSLEMFRNVKRGEYSLPNFRALIVISIVLNIIVESISIENISLPLGVTWINFNTADPLDAVSGILAVLLFVLTIRLCSKTNKEATKPL